MTELTAQDATALALILAVIGWALLEHWRSRAIPGTVAGQLRRRWGASTLLVGLALGYAGRLIGFTPWFSRPAVLTGVALMAIGYRLDRRASRA